MAGPVVAIGNYASIAFAPFTTVETLTAFTAATATTAAAETVTARGPLFTRTGDVDRDLAALKILVMKLFDGFLRVFRRTVFNERKPA